MVTKLASARQLEIVATTDKKSLENPLKLRNRGEARKLASRGFDRFYLTLLLLPFPAVWSSHDDRFRA